MRYLRKQVLNRRAPADSRLAVDITNGVVMNTTNNLLMPKGATSDRPVSPLTGMIRYNTTTNEVEIYQGVVGSESWRSLRFKEPTEIVQQNLGPGDAVEVLFGILNPAPPTIAESGLTWNIVQQAKQLIVLVDNVIQISGTNFSLILNPARTSGNILSFDSGTKTITSSNTSIINFSSLKFQPDNVITISGSGSNDGTYTINTVTSSTLVVDEAVVTETEGNTISIVGPYSLGYYIAFDSPVPLGKIVTVYHGFDQ
jgi:hypothetical protein